MIDTDSKEGKGAFHMLATAKSSITELDSDISKLMRLRDMWVKITGKLEGDLYGRIKP